MMKPKLITFTGFDDYTSIDEMEDISRRYPVEWGVLFSPTRQGNDTRYPSVSAVRRLILRAAARKMQIASHLCGDYARRVMDGQVQIELPVDLDCFNRVQVNHAEPIPERLHDFSVNWAPRVIAQSKSTTWMPRWSGFDVLFDASGGRGVAPTAWPPYPGYYVGYAGGISLDNILETVSMIAADNAYWIDMETGVRTDNLFDLKKCRAVCEAIFGGKA